MLFGALRLRKSEEGSQEAVIRRRGATVVSPALVVVVFFSLMPVFFTGEGGVGFGRWIGLAEGSSGGAGKNGYAGGGGFWSSAVAPSNVGLAVAVTAMAGIAVAATIVYSRRGSLRSPWSQRRRKHALLPKQWKSFFTPEGKLRDGGVRFLKKVRSGGVDPSIRSEVWPFLLGMYDLNSTETERDSIRQQKQKEYESLRKICRQIHRRNENNSGLKQTANHGANEDSGELSQFLDSRDFEDVDSSRRSVSPDVGSPRGEELDQPTSDSVQDGDHEKSVVTSEDASANDTESTDSESSEESKSLPLLATEEVDGDNGDLFPSTAETKTKTLTDEDFATWQRIIRLDAVRANDEWLKYSPSQASVSETKAHRLATRVGLKDYEHLAPCRVFHAARLVAVLEAYAVYDQEIGYCQGMSDLLSPIITVVENDDEAFWCFVGFMKKARHNFRLDEVGIRRQLSIVSKIIKYKDNHLYRHLEKLEAEDCFFVYRMVVVLFRRELTFEQTLCLWEVMWADQAAIRAGITKSTWGRIRMRAPPTEDLLLYAIAASVLQRRKTIIEKYSGMDEIMRECNSMAGHLDIWKLLDDAHDLVVNLHDKI